MNFRAILVMYIPVLLNSLCARRKLALY